ncbi:MAG: TVP38/TMEM64 family protein [Phycisphaeraceae bacterium]|nr:MAG: TVP38/TMEM64 family protein [Phycisphaeraceae bacterium]
MSTETPPSHGTESSPASPTLGSVFSRLGPAGVLGVLWLVLPPLGSILLFVYINSIGVWLREHGHAGVAMYVAAFAVLAGTALLPTYASAILGGWAFGFAVGFPAALGGFLGGSLVGYTIARWAAKERVVDLINEQPKWRGVRDALVGGHPLKALAIITLLRVPPNSPFALTNLVLASLRLPLWAYAAGTLVGMAPRTGVAVYFAASLRGMTAEDAARQVPGWWVAAGVGLSVVVLIVLGMAAKHALSRLTTTRPGVAFEGES